MCVREQLWTCALASERVPGALSCRENEKQKGSLMQASSSGRRRHVAATVVGVILVLVLVLAVLVAPLPVAPRGVIARARAVVAQALARRGARAAAAHAPRRARG